ncbi:MAG TPA: hypothetical protein VFM46_17985 [Pseudomonadales bacterium]|nr:hypothetical protein [Pseudomonadales bacterium]
MKQLARNVIVLTAITVPLFPLSVLAQTDLEEKVDALSKEVESLKSDIKKLEQKNSALEQEQHRDVGKESGLSLSGYGEMNYSRPAHQPEHAHADLTRAVVGIGYRYDEQTRFFSEFEIEHAISSQGDSGEVAVEQFYLDHKLNPALAVKAGLFLIPAGILNVEDEPTRIYGVQRNFVETLIIPSTWREGGITLRGSYNSGFGWDAGVTTAMSIQKWEFTPAQPFAVTANDLVDNAPLQQTHQELSNANAQHLAEFLRLRYRVTSQLSAGASVFSGNMGKFDLNSPNNHLQLSEFHTRWSPDKAEFSALYARATISQTRELNQLHADATQFVPAEFWGGYLQAAYHLWKQDRRELVPYLRWERFNEAKKIEGVSTDAQPTERVWTYGFSFYLNPKIVIKTDYQTFKINSDFNRFNLGLSLAF